MIRSLRSTVTSSYPDVGSVVPPLNPRLTIAMITIIAAIATWAFASLTPESALANPRVDLSGSDLSKAAAAQIQDDFAAAAAFLNGYLPPSTGAAFEKCPVKIRFVSSSNDRDGFLPASDNVCRTPLEINHRFLPDILSPNLRQGFRALLIHELTHWLRRHYQATEAGWLDEGLAVWLQMEYLRLWDQKFIARAEQTFVMELAPERGEFHSGSPKYAVSYLFLHYVIAHFGGQPLVQELLTSPQSGWDNLQSSISRLRPSLPIAGLPDSFFTGSSVFTHFFFAWLLNSPTRAVGELFYLSANHEPALERLVNHPNLPGSPSLCTSTCAQIGRLTPDSFFEPISETNKIYLISTGEAGTDPAIHQIETDQELDSATRRWDGTFWINIQFQN